MQTNKKVKGFAPKTHENAPVRHLNPVEKLRRAALSCLLFEDNFYEDGVSIADRIKDLVRQSPAKTVVKLAIEARNEGNLRHLPLWLINAMLPHPGYRKHVYEPIVKCIQRPDEICELIAMYFDGGRKPIPNQMKLGLAEAFRKFDAYQLAKYDRPREVRLRDAMFLTHPKPINKEQKEIWEKLIEGNLSSPDTWEVSLSAGESKAETFTRLMEENRLGAMATIRNLRGMVEAGVDRDLIKDYLLGLHVSKVLPYRFFVATKFAPEFESELEELFFQATDQMGTGYSPLHFSGRTIVLTDVSGSMHCPMSNNSVVERVDAAGAIAALAREYSDDVAVYAFASNCERVPARRGFALVDALNAANVGWSTNAGSAYRYAHRDLDGDYDRIIIVTDGQSWDRLPDPQQDKLGYIINVAPYEYGVGYGPWQNIDGFSPSVFKWMAGFEAEFA